MNDKNNSEGKIFQQAIKHHLDGEYNIALNFYQKLLKINPNIAAVHNNIGLIQKELKENQLALKSFLKAIDIDSNFIEAHNNIGIIYEEMRDYKKGIFHCKTAIKLDPNFSKAYNNLGSLYDEMGETNLAIENYKKCLELNPKSVESYNNLGSVYRYSGQYNKAIEYYQQGIKIDKNFFKIRKNFGLLLLLLSNFEQGFKEFEWRIKEKSKKEYRDTKLKSKLWQGENLDKKSILILSEQGFGDIIHFARYIYELEERYDVKIIFRTHKKLIHLFYKSNIHIIDNEKNIPELDYHVYVMSLANFYYQKEKKLLKQYYFINKNNDIYSKWKKTFAKINTPKIGIYWQGSKNYMGDRYRSIPLNYFESLFEIRGVDYINLQKGFGEEQINTFKYKDKLHNFSSLVDNGENAFEDTIEIIRNLDLVITPDTSIAHLSSSIGIKTWVLIPQYGLDWRWLLNNKQTVWYSKTKLFRQKKLNDWHNVINTIKGEIIKDLKK